ncbi:MAG TPA: glycosyltransferase family 2 protein [Candidatus Babeliales bacterium]|jgi:glycosyltransferase involved in cell wall biosynthesis|nr:glycosyltransferase family 2 protein [Candidatus Babeliales bacterium]
MMHFFYYVCIGIIGCFITITADTKPAKIVGLIQVRNEEIFIKQCLKALSCYTDAIVILDDASTDNTLNIIQSLAKECSIEKIIRNAQWSDWDERSNRNKLLAAARSISGTHMIIIDADEMFTACCLDNNYLRKKILALQPGDSMGCQLINLWRSIHVYRDDNSVWVPRDMARIFCDNGTAFYTSGYIHDSPLPRGLTGTYYPSTDINYGILHFQFINWANLLVKQAWYRCLEHMHNPKRPTQKINEQYGKSKDETNIKFKQTRTEWFNYPFFDTSIFNLPEQWRKKQIQAWFDQYGKKFFKYLDIWDIDWL